MTEIELGGLDGSNPMGFLAALGLVAVLNRMTDDARLAWSSSVLPFARMTTDLTEDDIITAVLTDCADVLASVPMCFPGPDNPVGDVKFARPADTRAFLETATRTADDGLSERVAASLVAEVSFDGSGKAKPSDLHFTAGRQLLLDMARGLGQGVVADHLTEALNGPWLYRAQLPSFMWDASDDRIYALGAINPAGETKPTVPGADWLAFRGLTLVPVVGRIGRTLTPGSGGTWKSGSWSWPLWSTPLRAAAIRVLMAQVPRRHRDGAPLQWAPPIGVFRLMRSAIVRSDQGGYGTMRAPRIVWERPVAR